MATQLAAENVVGRDGLIKKIWQMLGKFSLVFTAERRIGKTTVMKKMEAEIPEGVIASYLDLEKVDTPEQFVEVLLEKVAGLLPKSRKAKNSLKKLLYSLRGSEIAGIIKIPAGDKQDWKPALEKTFTCICKHHPKATILFLFDELPYMLQKISVLENKEANNANTALAILDSLRAIREEQKNLRMIFSGSIGLHHVIKALRGTEYVSEPLNNMETVEIGPLARSDAEELAKRLLREENVEFGNQNDVVDAIVEGTDRVPFYIERVIQRFALAETVVTPEDVRRQIQLNLTDDKDHWEMEHFRTRIPIYYPGNVNTVDRVPLLKATVVTLILDIMGTAEKPLSIDKVNDAVIANLPLDDRPLVIQLLKNLSQDHYLICDEQKNYSFRFPLIKQWWKLAQGL